MKTRARRFKAAPARMWGRPSTSVADRRGVPQLAMLRRRRHPPRPEAASLRADHRALRDERAADALRRLLSRAVRIVDERCPARADQHGADHGFIIGAAADRIAVRHRAITDRQRGRRARGSLRSGRSSDAALSLRPGRPCNADGSCGSCGTAFACGACGTAFACRTRDALRSLRAGWTRWPGWSGRALRARGAC